MDSERPDSKRPAPPESGSPARAARSARPTRREFLIAGWTVPLILAKAASATGTLTGATGVVTPPHNDTIPHTDNLSTHVDQMHADQVFGTHTDSIENHVDTDPRHWDRSPHTDTNPHVDGTIHVDGLPHYDNAHSDYLDDTDGDGDLDHVDQPLPHTDGLVHADNTPHVDTYPHTDGHHGDGYIGNHVDNYPHLDTNNHYDLDGDIHLDTYPHVDSYPHADHEPYHLDSFHTDIGRFHHDGGIVAVIEEPETLPGLGAPMINP